MTYSVQVPAEDTDHLTRLEAESLERLHELVHMYFVRWLLEDPDVQARGLNPAPRVFCKSDTEWTVSLQLWSRDGQLHARGLGIHLEIEQIIEGELTPDKLHD